MLGLVTLGQLLVLLVGGIDLSVGAVMNATLIIIALMNQHDDDLAARRCSSASPSALRVGLVNGLLVSFRDVPPFAATLGMLAVIQGAILVYTKGVPAGQIPSSLRPVALSGIGIVPYSLLICLGVAARTDVRASARDVRAQDLCRRPVPRGRSARGDLDDDDPRFART